MTESLTLLARQRFKEFYPNIFAFLGEVFGILLSLLVISYTARAFGPALRFGGNYFSYILIGETALAIPMALFLGTSRLVQESISNGTLDSFCLHSDPPQLAFTLLSVGYIPKEIFRISITLLFAAMFFGFSFQSLTPGNATIVVLLHLICAPAFAGMGSMASAVLIFFGRGAGVLAQLGSASLILAGAFFPISVLPKGLEGVASVSPFYIILSLTRDLLNGTPVSTSALPILALGSTVLCFSGYTLLGLSLTWVRKKGAPLLTMN